KQPRAAVASPLPSDVRSVWGGAGGGEKEVAKDQISQNFYHPTSDERLPSPALYPLHCTCVRARKQTLTFPYLYQV
ncbi:MAG: hypothetical protein AAF597_18255, partial [Bacteroidota bacterium]